MLYATSTGVATARRPERKKENKRDGEGYGGGRGCHCFSGSFTVDPLTVSRRPRFQPVSQTPTLHASTYSTAQHHRCCHSHGKVQCACLLDTPLLSQNVANGKFWIFHQFTLHSGFCRSQSWDESEGKCPCHHHTSPSLHAD